MRSIFAILIFIIFTATPSAYSAQLNTLENILWEREYGDDTSSYISKSFAFSQADASLYISGIYRSSAKGVPPKVQGIWVWKINSSGEKISEIRLKNAEGKNIINVEALAITDVGNIIMVVTLEGKSSELIKINSSGEQLLLKDMAKGRRISKIIHTVDNKLLLIGQENTNALLMKVDGTGQTIWDKLLDRGKDDMFVDGISTEDGGFLMVENSGKTAQFFMAESDVWITKYDSNGIKQSEKTFPGRHGNIVKGKDGSYVVVYDMSGTAKQDIWVKALDSSLNEKWSTQITETEFGLEKFTIAAMSNGNYVAAGPIKLRPWVSYIDANGIKKWDFYDGSVWPSIGTELVSKGDNMYIISSVVSLTEMYTENNKIKTIKFLPE